MDKNSKYDCCQSTGVKGKLAEETNCAIKSVINIYFCHHLQRLFGFCHFPSKKGRPKTIFKCKQSNYHWLIGDEQSIQNCVGLRATLAFFARTKAVVKPKTNYLKPVIERRDIEIHDNHSSGAILFNAKFVHQLSGFYEHLMRRSPNAFVQFTNGNFVSVFRLKHSAINNT